MEARLRVSKMDGALSPLLHDGVPFFHEILLRRPVASDAALDRLLIRGDAEEASAALLEIDAGSRHIITDFLSFFRWKILNGYIFTHFFVSEPEGKRILHR